MTVFYHDSLSIEICGNYIYILHGSNVCSILIFDSLCVRVKVFICVCVCMCLYELGLIADRGGYLKPC